MLYKEVSGTSFAAPHVSGALALMMARFPDATREELISRLIAKTTLMPGDRETISGGMLNLSKVLRRDLIGTFGWF